MGDGAQRKEIPRILLPSHMAANNEISNEDPMLLECQLSALRPVLVFMEVVGAGDLNVAGSQIPLDREMAAPSSLKQQDNYEASVPRECRDSDVSPGF